jgi:hypothetical protein
MRAERGSKGEAGLIYATESSESAFSRTTKEGMRSWKSAGGVESIMEHAH